jgi:hypothetical protein
MLIVRSDKYETPLFERGMIYVRRNDQKTGIFVECCKYVDVVRNFVYLLRGDTSQVVPTCSTIRKYGHNGVDDVERAIKASSTRNHV